MEVVVCAVVVVLDNQMKQNKQLVQSDILLVFMQILREVKYFYYLQITKHSVVYCVLYRRLYCSIIYQLHTTIALLLVSQILNTEREYLFILYPQQCSSTQWFIQYVCAVYINGFYYYAYIYYNELFFYKLIITQIVFNQFSDKIKIHRNVNEERFNNNNMGFLCLCL